MTARLIHPWIEGDAAPLYVWRVPAEPTREGLSEALEAIQRWAPSLDAPYGWINDPRNLRIAILASERKLLADHLRTVQPHAAEWCAGMATLATQPTIRGIGTAVGWVTPYRFPTVWCADIEQAWVWTRERLAERGVGGIPSTPPPHLR